MHNTKHECNAMVVLSVLRFRLSRNTVQTELNMCDFVSFIHKERILRTMGANERYTRFKVKTKSLRL